jgi:hypothetical protein
MVNYYFKYLELLDTVFLALKKKPLRQASLIPLSFRRYSSFSRIPPCFPSLSDCFAVLHPIKWKDQHCKSTFMTLSQALLMYQTSRGL